MMMIAETMKLCHRQTNDAAVGRMRPGPPIRRSRSPTPNGRQVNDNNYYINGDDNKWPVWWPTKRTITGTGSNKVRSNTIVILPLLPSSWLLAFCCCCCLLLSSLPLVISSTSSSASSSSSLSSSLTTSTTTSEKSMTAASHHSMQMMARPAPFSPYYRSECDLILPASLSTLPMAEEPEPEPEPEPMPESYYFGVGGGPGAGSPQELDLLSYFNGHYAAAASAQGASFFDAIRNPVSPAVPVVHTTSSSSTTAATAGSGTGMNPVLQKYLAMLTSGSAPVATLTRRSSYMPGGHICMQYRDIDQAVAQAKMLLGIYTMPYQNQELSSDYPKPGHVAKVGEVLVVASAILGQAYGLTKEALVFALPRIDTTQTVIRDICPAFLQPVKCELSKYRTLSGMCNNLDYPSWGSARSAMLRFMPPDYADGLTAPRISRTGQPLPPPRIVSFVLHQDDDDYDHEITYLVIAWGQMVDHDLTFASMPKDDQDKSVKCCKYPPSQRHPNCYPIQVPADDPYQKFYQRKCMDFVRSTPGVKPNCPLGPRHQINVVTAFLDADIVYGHTLATSKRLREYVGGRLKSTKSYRNLGLKDLLPMKTNNPDNGCERAAAIRHGPAAAAGNNYCFDTGDDRSNVQLQLTVMHTIFLRHHNQIADLFGQMNPHWNDEKIFQETRRLVGAMIQHITYNEFLPIVVGRQAMAKYGLNLLKYGYYHGYDPKTNPGIRVEFQAAAFRFGHSIVPDTVDRYNKFHQKIESLRLASLLRQPFSLYHPGVLDTFIFGLINQPAYRVDSSLANEMTNHLFEKPGEQFGLDLAAINVLRGREMGVPGYNDIREYCGLARIRHFTDLYGLMPNATIRRYMELYEHVDDIDLWSAGIAEQSVMGAMVGPTFACIIAEQFAAIRNGDRFWYENEGWHSQFTPQQLAEIRKVKLARVLCESADDIDTIQLYPLLAAHPTSNPRVDCNDLPEMNLTPWRDGGGGGGGGGGLPYMGGGSMAMNLGIHHYKASAAGKKAAAAAAKAA